MTAPDDREAGATLAEALAALLILGLAIGGLVHGTWIISRAQASVSRTLAQATATRGAQKAFEAALATPAAGRAAADGRLDGRRRALGRPCEAVTPCGVILSDRGRDGLLVVRDEEGVSEQWILPSGRGAYLVYNSTAGSFPDWNINDNRGLLRSISVVWPVGGDDTPMISARLWIEQSAACEFDTIAKTCRSRIP